MKIKWFSISVGLIYLFLSIPVLYVLLTSIHAGEYLKFPFEGFTLHWFKEYFSTPTLVDAFITSVVIAIISTLIAMILGTSVALFLARYKVRLRGLYNMLILAPMLFPQILTSIALYIYYSNLGMQDLHFIGLLIGHSLVTLPFVYLIVQPAFMGYDWSLNEAAQSLGSSSINTFWKITLPIIRPSIISGAVFSFLISFDNFNISLLLVGPGSSVLPTELFSYLNFGYDPMIAAVSTVNIIISLVVLIIISRFVGIERIVNTSDPGIEEDIK